MRTLNQQRKTPCAA